MIRTAGISAVPPASTPETSRRDQRIEVERDARLALPNSLHARAGSPRAAGGDGPAVVAGLGDGLDHLGTLHEHNVTEQSI